MDTYSSGTKVRVKAGTGFLDRYSDTWQYENMTGKVVSSTTVTWRQIRSWESEANSPSEAVQVYKIHLDIGIEADNVTGDCLETWNASDPHCV